MLKGDTTSLQPWFIIRRASWWYTVAYTSGCHEDYEGARLHHGLLCPFWQQEILVWNLVFISPEASLAVGVLSPWLPGAESKVHWKCKTEFPSFSRGSQLGLFLSSCNMILFKSQNNWVTWKLGGLIKETKFIRSLNKANCLSSVWWKDKKWIQEFWDHHFSRYLRSGWQHFWFYSSEISIICIKDLQGTV